MIAEKAISTGEAGEASIDKFGVGTKTLAGLAVGRWSAETGHLMVSVRKDWHGRKVAPTGTNEDRGQQGAEAMH